MKILVLSDSHSGLSFMRRCIDAVKPDAMIHLGDYFDDGEFIGKEYRHIPMYQVPGNCDHYRIDPWQQETRIIEIFGVKLFLTHGHRYNVKMTTTRLLKEARASGVDAVLYGHTHVADLSHEEDGLWVMNPGSCGYFGGSVGLITVEDGKIRRCRLLQQDDLL